MKGTCDERWEKSDERLRNSLELPIILLTAKNQGTDLMQGFDTGANDYIVKPFTKDEPFASIDLRHLLDKHPRCLKRRDRAGGEYEQGPFV